MCVTVLSYNVSFEAMTNKFNPKFSAAALGKKCIPTVHNPRLTICAEHMAHTIDKVAKNTTSLAIDFVAIQEASRWDELQRAAVKSLIKMGHYNSIKGFTEMATFYDTSKYKLDKKYEGGYNHDRPFQILVFKNKLEASGIIFINTHNPHGFPINSMSKALSKAAQTMNFSDDEKKYRIIIAGDFNDTGWLEFLEEGFIAPWTPFAYKDVNQKNVIFIDTTVSMTKNLIYSCCKGNGDWEDYNTKGLAEGHRGGDYIFDSKVAANILVPQGYSPLHLQSDHLPVVASL